MKRKYNPYPQNHYRVGTDEYEDYLEYEEKFYNNPEFHEERIKRGEKLLKTSRVKTAIASSIGAATLTGAALHIVSMFSSLGPSTPSPIANLFINFTATVICGGATLSIVREIVQPEIINQSNYSEDIEVSKKMIKSIRNKRV